MIQVQIAHIQLSQRHSDVIQIRDANPRRPWFVVLEVWQICSESCDISLANMSDNTHMEIMAVGD
jgi:hypothetical protein